MSSKINLQTCEYACKSSIFQDNQLIYYKKIHKQHSTKHAQNVILLCNNQLFFDNILQKRKIAQFISLRFV